MDHVLLLLHRRDATPLGCLHDTFELPTQLPGGAGELAKAINQLRDAQQEASNLNIPGMDPKAAQAMILTAITEEGVDPKEFLGQFFGTGAAVVCAAAGSPALAPLCAQGGKVIGEVLAGLQATPQGPTSTKHSEALQGMINADFAKLKANRDKILYGLAARFNSAPEAMEEARAVVDLFYPLQDRWCCPKADQSPANGMCQVKLSPFVAGFFTPILVTGACCLIGKNYSVFCGQEWEWQGDYSAPIQGKNAQPLEPGWVEKMLAVIEQTYKDGGINLSASFDALRADSDAKAASGGRWYSGSFVTNAEAMGRLYRDLRDVLWPALEMAMQKRLQGVVARAAVRANERLVGSVGELTDVLATRAGCTTVACRQDVQRKVGDIAEALRDESPEAVMREVEAAFPSRDGSAPSSSSTTKKKPSSSPLRPVLFLGAGAALVYAIHRLIKRYV